MKRFIAFVLPFLLVCSVLFASNANSAISIKPLVQLSSVDPDSSGLVISGEQIAVFGNRSQNGFVQLINTPTGNVNVDLIAGIESFVSAGTVDPEGNFVFVGAGSNPIVGTLPPINGVLNPDNVIPDPVSTNKSDAVNLWFWKLDKTGKILESASMLMPSATIPTSVLVDKFGMTIAGTTFTDPGNCGFILNWNGKPTLIGKSSTQVLGISRGSDGSVIAIGQSAETLFGKPLRGRTDGFLARITNGKVVLVQRSSDVKAERAWRSTSNNLLLGGYSNSSAAITKFNDKFLPTWTDRYPANGSALTASVGNINYGTFLSTGPVKALPTWKRKNALLLLTFNSKGVITAANFATTTNLMGFAASAALGPVVLAGGFLYRT